jgi:hypothetical protein
MRFTSADREAVDVAALITGLELGLMEVDSSVAQNGLHQHPTINFHSSYADGIVAYFENANAGNRVLCEWEVYG